MPHVHGQTAFLLSQQLYIYICDLLCKNRTHGINDFLKTHQNHGKKSGLKISFFKIYIYIYMY